MKRYNVINADGDVIRSIVANSQKGASEKVKHLYGKASCFLEIQLSKNIENYLKKLT